MKGIVFAMKVRTALLVSIALIAAIPALADSIQIDGPQASPSGVFGNTFDGKSTLTRRDTSLNVAGYNVYRGTISGGPYTKLNSSLLVSDAYTDNTVQAGQTYYYVATSVDTTNDESAYSSPPVQAITP